MQVVVQTLQAPRDSSRDLECPVDWDVKDLRSWSNSRITRIELSKVVVVKDGRDVEHGVRELQSEYETGGEHRRVKLVEPMICRQSNLAAEQVHFNQLTTVPALCIRLAIPLPRLCLGSAEPRQRSSSAWYFGISSCGLPSHSRIRRALGGWRQRQRLSQV